MHCAGRITASYTVSFLMCANRNLLPKSCHPLMFCCREGQKFKQVSQVQLDVSPVSHGEGYESNAGEDQ